MKIPDFTYEIHKLPGYALVLKRDGKFVREIQFEYADQAEQEGIEWVAGEMEAFNVSVTTHPAGRHLRLAEDAA